MLSFLPGPAIPNMLGVSHTTRRLCACLHELDLSSCRKLEDVRFVSSLVSLRTLDLSDCSDQLVDVSPLSSVISLTSLKLHNCRKLNNLAPLSTLTSLTNLHLRCCGELCDVSLLLTLTSLTNLDLSWCEQLLDVSPVKSHLLDQLEPDYV